MNALSGRDKAEPEKGVIEGELETARKETTASSARPGPRWRVSPTAQGPTPGGSPDPEGHAGAEQRAPVSKAGARPPRCQRQTKACVLSKLAFGVPVRRDRSGPFRAENAELRVSYCCSSQPRFPLRKRQWTVGRDVDHQCGSSRLKFRLHRRRRHADKGLCHFRPPLKTCVLCPPRRASLPSPRLWPGPRPAAAQEPALPPALLGLPGVGVAVPFFLFFSPYTLLSKSHAGRADTKNTTSSQRIHRLKGLFLYS